MFKNISIFALAFAFVGLTGCEDTTTTVEGDEVVPAEVETEVLPADEVMEDAEATMEEGAAEMEAAGEEMEAAGEEMMEDADAAVEEVVDGE